MKQIYNTKASTNLHIRSQIQNNSTFHRKQFLSEKTETFSRTNPADQTTFLMP